MTLYDLEIALAKAYAKHLIPILGEIAQRTICDECWMTLDEEERIHLCLDEAIEIVDDSEVLKTFQEITACNQQLPLPCQLFDETWRNQLWLDGDWTDVVVEQVLHLNNV